MIFNDQPFYNEPGYEYHADRARAEEYNRNIESFTITHAMIPWLSKRLVAPRGLSSAPEASTPAASSPVVSTPATPTTPVMAVSTPTTVAQHLAAQQSASQQAAGHQLVTHQTATYQIAVQQMTTQQTTVHPYPFASPQAAATYLAIEQQAQTVPITPPPAGSASALPFHIQHGAAGVAPPAPAWYPPGHWIPYYQSATHLHTANYAAPLAQHTQPPPPPPPPEPLSFSSAAPEFLAAQMANHFMNAAATKNGALSTSATTAASTAAGSAGASASSTSAPAPALLSPIVPGSPFNPPTPRPARFTAEEPAADDPIWAEVVRGHFSIKAPLILGTVARFAKSARATDHGLGANIGELEGWLKRHGFCSD